MKTRIVSLNHPSVGRDGRKLLGRNAVATDGRVGVLEGSPLVIAFEDKTSVPAGRFVKLVVEED